MGNSPLVKNGCPESNILVVFLAVARFPGDRSGIEPSDEPKDGPFPIDPHGQFVSPPVGGGMKDIEMHCDVFVAGAGRLDNTAAHYIPKETCITSLPVCVHISKHFHHSQVQVQVKKGKYSIIGILDHPYQFYHASFKYSFHISKVYPSVLVGPA